MRLQSRAWMLITLPMFYALGACGTTNPPPQLIEARAAYQHAETSAAAKMNPAELHVARESLDRAELTFNQRGDSAETNDLAYVAMRKAELAEALGSASAARQQKANLEKEAGLTTQEMLARNESRLKMTESELARERDNVSKEKDNVAKEKDNVAKEKELTAAERAARIAAEKKAHDAMDALAKSLAVKEDSRGTVITISGGVLFATGQSTLLAGAQEQLNRVADALKTQAEHHFVVEGHTDSQGTDAVNNELSKKRASAVRDYLIVRGVAADAITAIGLGSTRAIADNKTTEGRAMNRRVEIIVGK